MNDRKLYEQLLGISEPWHVERVDLRLDEGEVLIYVKGTCGCRGVSRVREAVSEVRHQRTSMAAPGHLSVPDDPGGDGTADSMS